MVGPEPVERGEMLGHAVAHVALKAVAGMGGAEAGHQAVARHLGDDRGGGDRGHEAVAADHRLAIAAGIDAVAAVDKDKARLTGSAATARASAHNDARKILSRSMRDGGANATATCARAQMRS